MFAEEMITEATGHLANPPTLILPFLIIESYVYTRQQGVPGVFELPLHQLLGSNRGPVLLEPRQHGVRSLGLDSVEHPETIVRGTVSV